MSTLLEYVKFLDKQANPKKANHQANIVRVWWIQEIAHAACEEE